MKPTLLIGSQYPAALIEHLAAARQSVCIVMFAWEVPTAGHYKKISQLNDAIVSAKERGVSVRCIVHFHKTLAELLRRGVNAKKIHIGGLLHTKLCIIDERVTFIGSHNFTERAFTSNAEASLLVQWDEPPAAFIQHFNTLWQVTG